MKKLLLSILIALITFPEELLGCTCFGPATFCESITSSDDEIIADLVIRGTYKGWNGIGSEIEVGQVILGSTYQKKVNYRTSQCTYFPYELIKDQEYIFALKKSTRGHLYLFSCSISYLPIVDNMVKGAIAPSLEGLPYEDFLKLKNFEKLQSNTVMNLISVYPNPTNGIVNIKNISAGRSLLNLSVSLFDVQGRNVTNHINIDDILPKEVMTINVSDLSPGVYIVRIYDRFSERVSRIVKH